MKRVKYNDMVGEAACKDVEDKMHQAKIESDRIWTETNGLIRRMVWSEVINRTRAISRSFL